MSIFSESLSGIVEGGIEYMMGGRSAEVDRAADVIADVAENVMRVDEVTMPTSEVMGRLAAEGETRPFTLADAANVANTSIVNASPEVAQFYRVQAEQDALRQVEAVRNGQFITPAAPAPSPLIEAAPQLNSAVDTDQAARIEAAKAALANLRASAPLN